jgi:hypothetical protein
MKIKYEILGGSPHIKKVECIKETPEFVIMSVWCDFLEETFTERRKKEGVFFDTWDEAKAALITKALDRCDTLRVQLLLAQGHLSNIAELKEEDYR